VTIEGCSSSSTADATTPPEVTDFDVEEDVGVDAPDDTVEVVETNEDAELTRVGAMV